MRNDDLASELPPLDSIRLFDDTPDTRTRPSAGAHPHLKAAAVDTATTAVPPRPETAPERPARALRSTASEIDWVLVRTFREEIADTLTTLDTTTDTGDLLTDDDRRERGLSLIQQRIREHLAENMRSGREWTPEYERAIVQAVYDAVFGLGRLQPLVDDDTITDVHIIGYDDVWITRRDGTRERGEDVADSDAELIEFINHLATRHGRAFSDAQPRLRLALGSLVRLTASHPAIARRPYVILRMHRLIDVTFDDLLDLQSLTPVIRDFLTAAIKGKLSIIVAGLPAVGKTTLLRAMCNVLDPLEPVGVIESEREIHLDLMNDRHPVAMSYEARPGDGAVGADGRRPGQITLDDLVEDSLRLSAERIIVGEVLGPEIGPMFKVMQAGAGSLSTVHARSVEDTISRLVTLSMEQGRQTTADLAHRQIYEHIDFIVYVRSGIDGAGQLHRWISDIAEVTRGEGDRAESHPVFATAHGTYEARPAQLPTRNLPELEEAGFNVALLTPGIPA